MPTVTVELARLFMGIEHSAEDELISLFIGAAEEWFEDYTGKTLSSFNPVPDGIKRGILLLVAHYYEHREAFSSESLLRVVPGGIIAIAESHRASRFGLPIEDAADGV